MAEASSSTLAGLMRNVYLLFFPFLCFCFIFVLFFYCPSISFSLSFFLLHLLSERKSVRLSVVCPGRHSGYSYGTDVSRQDSGSTQVTVARTGETPPPLRAFVQQTIAGREETCWKRHRNRHSPDRQRRHGSFRFRLRRPREKESTATTHLRRSTHLAGLRLNFTRKKRCHQPRRSTRRRWNPKLLSRQNLRSGM